MLRESVIENSKSVLLLICFVYLISGHPAFAAGPSYAIVLASKPGTDNQWKPKPNDLFDGYKVYVSQIVVKGRAWQRLNLGFFSTRDQAAVYAKKLQSAYPGAWVNTVDSNEVTLAGKTALFATTATISSPTSAPAPAAAKPGSVSGLSDEQLNSLLQRAKTEFTAKNYAQAIRYFSAIVSSGDNKYSREALELLGLSRQRNGQEAHARDLYEKYISLYPEGEATDRVKQRLSGLLTETAAPKQSLSMRSEKPASESETYGSISQFYSNDTTTTSDAGSINTLSRLITFFDITNIRKSIDYEHRFQFTADDSYDYLETGNKNEFRYVEMYYDFSFRSTGSSFRLGRQTLRTGGLYTRYDGASAGYQITPDMRFNLLGGYPVETDNKSSINEHKKFYGASFETGTFFNFWDMTLYHFRQTVDGIDDHISTGTEVRYRDRALSVFGLLDYDSLFDVVNIAQLNANLLMAGGRTAYMSAFVRKAPILSTSNALIGRTETSIEELLTTLNIEQIYQLARDRSANSETITLGGSQPLSSNTQLSADLTLSKIGSTAGSGGVPATESTGTDSYLGVQLVKNGLFMKNDTTVFGTRYVGTKTSDTYSLIGNVRLLITREWRINPRLQYDVRKLSDGRRQNKVRSLLRTDYRYHRNTRFDLEIGYDTTDETSNTGAFSNNSLFYNVGYRYDF